MYIFHTINIFAYILFTSIQTFVYLINNSQYTALEGRFSKKDCFLYK